MDVNRNTRVGTRETAPNLNETLGGGPLSAPTSTANGAAGYGRRVRRITLRSRLEKAGFWIMVAAAFVLLLLLLGWLLPPLVGGLVQAFYVGSFVGGLTLMNLQRPSAWANTLLGRRVFPVLRASKEEIWRLAGVNAGLTAVFIFFYSVVASVIGPFLAGILVFGGIVAMGVFYNRVRKVIIQP